ncbi:MAG: hypothetical protein NWF04_06830 [Candidatus Bathyarchaeota archaeon]|nr:hypothetical protein [Candidatus Bathyarchaeota archaeon]
MVDAEISKRLKEETEQIRSYLKEQGKIEENIMLPRKESVQGEAVAVAYPILGLEKYLGLCESSLRLAYFPSVSICHDVMRTVTYVKFGEEFGDDCFVVNGEKVDKRGMRAFGILERFRQDTGIKTRALVVSRNIFRAGEGAKGLGTSASAGAALVKAMIAAAYGEETSNNTQLTSAYARLFAGSASRSVTGGISVWFSYEGIKPQESYSKRVDNNQLDLKLVSVPMPLAITTDQMHKQAVLSPIYQQWITNKAKHTLELVKHVEENNVPKIGEIAEADTRFFHAMLLTRGALVWRPETVALIHLARKLKAQNIPAHYSIDTGPTVFFITQTQHAQKIAEEAKNIVGEKYPVVVADMAGPAQINKEQETKKALLEDAKAAS